MNKIHLALAATAAAINWDTTNDESYRPRNVTTFSTGRINRHQEKTLCQRRVRNRVARSSRQLNRRIEKLRA